MKIVNGQLVLEIGDVVKVSADNHHAVLLEKKGVYWKIISPGETACQSMPEDILLALQELGAYRRVQVQLSQLGQSTIDAVTFFVKYFDEKLISNGGSVHFYALYDTLSREHNLGDDIPV